MSPISAEAVPVSLVRSPSRPQHAALLALLTASAPAAAATGPLGPADLAGTVALLVLLGVLARTAALTLLANARVQVRVRAQRPQQRRR